MQEQSKAHISNFRIADFDIRIIFEDAHVNNISLIPSFAPFISNETSENLFFQMTGSPASKLREKGPLMGFRFLPVMKPSLSNMTVQTAGQKGNPSIAAPGPADIAGSLRHIFRSSEPAVPRHEAFFLPFRRPQGDL